MAHLQVKRLHSEGHGPTGWTPEGMLLAAAEASLMTELTSLAHEAQVRIGGYESTAIAREPEPPGSTCLSEIVVKVRLAVFSIEARQRVLELIEQASSRSCIFETMRMRPQVEVIVDVLPRTAVAVEELSSASPSST